MLFHLLTQILMAAEIHSLIEQFVLFVRDFTHLSNQERFFCTSLEFLSALK